MLSEASAGVPFMSLGELNARIESRIGDLTVLDVREREAYEAGHISGARLLPRGQLELRVNEELTDPTRRIWSIVSLAASLRWRPPRCARWVSRARWRWTAA